MQFKVVLLGTSGAGKTCLFRRFIDNAFCAGMASTISAACAEKVVETNSNESVTLLLWDTAGQERFQSVSQVYYRNANVGIIIFDVSNRESFQEAELWLQKIRQQEEHVIMYLVGQKCDLASRAVSKDEASRFAEDHNMTYWETSAKLGAGVNELFTHAAGVALQKHQKEQAAKIDVNVAEVQGGCC